MFGPPLIQYLIAVAAAAVIKESPIRAEDKSGEGAERKVGGWEMELRRTGKCNRDKSVSRRSSFLLIRPRTILAALGQYGMLA